MRVPIWARATDVRSCFRTLQALYRGAVVVPQSPFLPMRTLLFLSLFVPSLALAQETYPLRVGFTDEPVNDIMTVPDLVWRIQSMDVGTVVYVIAPTGAMRIHRNPEGGYTMIFGCDYKRSTGLGDWNDTRAVFVNAPFNIVGGNEIQLICDPGKFIYIERLMK